MENFHIDVFSKKLHQKSYHLATFKESLTKGGTDELPAHIIEQPDPPVVQEPEQPANVRRRQLDGETSWNIKPKANVPEKKHPCFLYEEHTANDPTKFYGYRDNYKSANVKTKVPNYALMIYDVSLNPIITKYGSLQKAKQRFRLVPVESHVKFEKQKTTEKQLQEEDHAAELPKKAKGSKKGFAAKLWSVQRGIKENNEHFRAVAAKKEPVATKRHDSEGDGDDNDGEDVDHSQSFSDNDDQVASEKEKEDSNDDIVDSDKGSSDDDSDLSEHAKAVKQQLKERQKQRNNFGAEENKDAGLDEEGSDDDSDGSSLCASIFSKSDDEERRP